ncbi:hypothetical protein [Amycolatopsis sp. FDAARGOS 1241]|uniref:hypothetical protein n=1 Tax=Amycolatopsis sp. FDAARGOS 1241 TaxID=2778070 RepID=UPI00194F2F85|nr:hypothetical protein [Amycolatopsis sp. FDAARGOS 1241]QRP45611.1 hypothetical protein I6J71_41955 [Amycolatopsis sp. FDAARGOS 1241]
MAPEDFSHLSLRSIAHQVRSELAAAGLPVTPEDPPPGTAGAQVAIDVAGNRVTVGWETHAILRDAAHDAWGDDPFGKGAELAAFTRLRTTIHTTMRDSMSTILTAAGFEVVKATEQLHVLRRLEMSPWQARRDAHFDSRHERKVTTWRQREEG